MIPILYNSGETAFTSNGIGRLADCISCTVTEERNGIYECQFQYPIDGEMFPEITEGRIIAVIHDDRHDIQPFDIYGRSAPINGVVTFYAHHVSYRLGNVILKPMTASSCVAAMAAIPENTYNPCPFTFWTDKTTTGNWTVTVPSAVRAILAGQQGSLLDIYGKGDYEFDRFAVKLYLERGADNGVSIRYGVNLTDITQDVDLSTSYTAVVPYWKGEDGTLVTLPEGYITQSGMAAVPVPLDLSSEWQDAPSVEQLRAKATARLSSSEAWLPKENIRVSFVDLSHTDEYKAVEALQRVSLCDKVSVYYGKMGVSAVKMKVVRVVFNVLTEMYDEIELGEAKNSLAQTIASQFSDTIADLPTTAKVYSMMTDAVDNATAQITGALGGFVRFMYDANGHMTEILIMDTDSVDTATNVWRWNSGGLGFSSNGYDGPYGTAITQDGQIVADYITAGTMDANLMRTGILRGRQGTSYWNLDTGELVVGGMSASDIAENVGESVIGVDTEFAQSQSSSTAPASGWSTVAPSWAAGWYIWQRTKTTTPNGVEYSDPVCISGRDGSGSQPGLNQATLYLYQRNESQPLAPTVSMTYTFANGQLTNIPMGWSRTIPSGSATCWVTSAAAISSDTAVTLAANAWQEPVAMAQSGATVAHMVSYFATNNSTTAPATEDFFALGQLIPLADHNGNLLMDHLGNVLGIAFNEPPTPTQDKPYVWCFQRSTYTDGSVLDSTKAIISVLAEPGVGVEDIVEEYYLSTSASSPTGGSWSSTQPEWREGRYIWTRTRVLWTDGETTYSTPILAAALNAANEAAAAAQAAAASANAREQTIYCTGASASNPPEAITTWVTNTGYTPNTWTAVRPAYDSTTPVLFVATQRQTVEQRSGTTCSCTTPVVDQTTTVIDGGHIITGTVDTGQLAATAVTADKIAANAITTDKLNANAVTAAKIASSAITTDKLDANAVTTDKIQANAVTSAKIAAGAVTTNAIQAYGVTTDKLAANAVTADKIESQAIIIDKLANGVKNLVNRAKITAVPVYFRSTTQTTPAAPSSIITWNDQDDAWTYAMPVPKRDRYFYTCERYVANDGSVSYSDIRELANATYTSKWTSASDSTYIDGGRIFANSVTANQIAAGAITANELNSSVITSINSASSEEQFIYRSAASGTSTMPGTTTWVTDVTGNQSRWTTKRPVYSQDYPVMFVAIQRQAVTGTVTCTTPVIDQTTTVIDGKNIITGSVAAGQIAAGAITTAKLNASAVTSAKLAANAVTADKIAAGAVTADMITTGVLQDASGTNKWDLNSGGFITTSVDDEGHGQRVRINNGIAIFSEKSITSSSYAIRGKIGVPEDKGMMLYDDRVAGSNPNVTIAAGPNADTLQLTGYSAISVEYGSNSASRKIVLKCNAIEIVGTNESVGVMAYDGTFKVVKDIDIGPDGTVYGYSYKKITVTNGLITSVQDVT